MVRLTDRPDMTLDVYRGRKTTIQQQLQSNDSKGLENKIYTMMKGRETFYGDRGQVPITSCSEVQYIL